jgi:uncharacterized RDD family membrane protein YckC
VAWAIDLAIRFGIYLLLSIALGPTGRLGVGVAMIAVFLLEWLYPVLFETFRDGATPGKLTLGLRVLHDDGTPVRLAASMVRNLVRFVDFLPLLYGFGLVTLVLDRDFRRLGDRAAGTIVVHRESAVSRAEGRPAVVAEAPAVALGRAEQQAVLEFAERAPRLNPERAAELAAIAGPLTRGAPDPVTRLYGIASHLAGAA